MINRKGILMGLCCLMIMGCGNKEEASLDINKIDSEDIVSSFCGVSEYAVGYSNISELSQNSEVIIYGEIKNIEYLVGLNGLCRANMDVEILKTVKGEFQEGDRIKIVKDQGIVTISDYLESYESEEAKAANREDYAQYTDEELDELYILQIEQDDIMSEIGQKSIFFLEESTFYETEQTYTRLSGPEAEYIEIADDQFMKVQNIASDLSMPYTLEISNEGSSEYTGASYTLEELIAEINASIAE